MIDSSSTIENYTNKSTVTSTTTAAVPTKLKANVGLTSDKKLLKTVSLNQGKSSLGDTSTGASFTSSSSTGSSNASLTDNKTYQITNSLNEACNLLNEKPNLFQATSALQPNSNITPSQKLKIVCKSSGYNVKDICNNLYEIDEHSNKDLIVDYFFSDNYQLEPNVNPTPTATVVQNNNATNGVNGINGGGPSKLVVVWNHNQNNYLGWWLLIFFLFDSSDSLIVILDII